MAHGASFGLTRRRLLASAALLSAIGAPSVRAQASGTPIKLVVGYPPGGITDSIARAIADRLGAELQRTVIVDNRPGAGGRVAAAWFRRQPADGEWVMLGTDSLMVHAPLVFRKLGFDVFKDFTPISQVVAFPYAFATGTAPRVSGMAEYMAWLQANPSQAAFGHPAPGSAPHFWGLLLGEKAGVPMTPVPYQGGAPMLAALAGGQVSAAINAVAVDMIEMHRSGRTRIVAVSGDKRVQQLADVPTIAELGLPSVPRGWGGLYLPANTDATIAARYAQAVRKVVAQADVRARLEGFGLVPTTGDPQELASLMQVDAGAWDPIIRRSGFKLDA